MKYGKRVCQSLKVVRKQIADANEIPYEITECPHQGNCPGTCPKCESELRYIENQLSLRRAAGKAISLVGLSLGISAVFTACGSNTTSQPKGPESIQETNSNEIEDVTDGLPMPIQNDSSSGPSTEAEASSMPDDGEDYIVDGDIEIPEEEINSLETENCYMVIETGPSKGEEAEEAEANQVFTVAEQQPEFPGGETALMDFIKKNLKYPAFASENGIQGRVTLSFIVEKDGSIDNIEVMRSPAEELSKEAIRIVKQMPKWKPGKVHGDIVRVKYVLPVTFRLE